MSIKRFIWLSDPPLADKEMALVESVLRYARAKRGYPREAVLLEEVYEASQDNQEEQRAGIPETLLDAREALLLALIDV